jgi:hypothetical protein
LVAVTVAVAVALSLTRMFGPMALGTMTVHSPLLSAVAAPMKLPSDTRTEAPASDVPVSVVEVPLKFSPPVTVGASGVESRLAAVAVLAALWLPAASVCRTVKFCAAPLNWPCSGVATQVLPDNASENLAVTSVAPSKTFSEAPASTPVICSLPLLTARPGAAGGAVSALALSGPNEATSLPAVSCAALASLPPVGSV